MNDGTNQARSLVTTSVSIFRVSLLPLGDYSVTVEAQNLEKQLVRQVRVVVAETSAIELRRELGSVRSQGGQLLEQHVARGTRFITEPQSPNRFQFSKQPTSGFLPVRDPTQGLNFTVRFRHRDGNGLGVEIQTNKSCFTHNTDSPFAWGSALLVSGNHGVTRAPRNGSRASYLPWHDRPNLSRFVHDDEIGLQA
jgi:hypothetical protein